MHHFHKPAAALAGGLLLLSAATPSDAISWVRGRGGISPGATVDPLFQASPPDPLIPTVSTGQFNDCQKGFFSQSDLGNGALRARSFINGGTGSVFSDPISGETIHFNNTTGQASSFDFRLDVDGHVTTGGDAFPVEQTFAGAGTFRTTFATFSVHIFAGDTVGPFGSANDWTTMLDQALFTTTQNIDGFPTSGSLDGFGADLADSISGSLPLDVGMNDFDVVLVLNATATVPSNFNSSIDMNFSNTAAFGIDSDVPFTSNSGVFLTGVNNVPEPAAGGAALLVAALAALRKPGRNAA